MSLKWLCVPSCRWTLASFPCGGTLPHNPCGPGWILQHCRAHWQMHWLLLVYTGICLSWPSFLFCWRYECYYSQSVANTCWALWDSREDKMNGYCSGRNGQGRNSCCFSTKSATIATLDCGGSHRPFGIRHPQKTGLAVSSGCHWLHIHLKMINTCIVPKRFGLAWFQSPEVQDDPQACCSLSIVYLALLTTKCSGLQCKPVVASVHRGPKNSSHFLANLYASEDGYHSPSQLSVV